MAKKLLYAENRASVKKEIKKFIKENNIESVEVSTSQELLVKAVEWFPDCIITGHTPPFLNAFDICAYKKYDSLLSKLPVIVVIPPEDKASARILKNGKNVTVAAKNDISSCLKSAMFGDELTILQDFMLDQPSLDSRERVMAKALESSGKYFEAESAWDYITESHFNSENFEKSLDSYFLNLANIIDLKSFFLCFHLPQGLFVFIKSQRPMSGEQLESVKSELYSYIPSDVVTKTKDSVFECILVPNGDALNIDMSECRSYVSEFRDPQVFRGCAGISAYAQDLDYIGEEHGDLIDKVLRASFLSLEHILLRERLSLLQTIDSVTCIKNRSNIMESLKKEFLRARRYGDNLSIFLLDINRFSSINTLYGYRVGDLILKELAEVILSSIRTIDDVGRYSGDKYLVILPETKDTDASVVVARIKKHISEHKFTGIAKDIEVAVTAGVTGLDATSDYDIQTLLDRLEAELFTAKTHH